MADMELNVPAGWESNKLVTNCDRDFLQVLKDREGLLLDSPVDSDSSNTQLKASEELELVVAESAAEQLQIARILSKIDEVIKQTQRLIAKYHRLKTGLLQDMLMNDMGERENSGSEESRIFNDRLLGYTPAEREAKQMEQIPANDSPAGYDALLPEKHSLDGIPTVETEPAASNPMCTDELPRASPAIAKLFNLLNHLLEIEVHTLAKLQVQRTGLRQDLLSGKVRVRQQIVERAAG